MPLNPVKFGTDVVNQFGRYLKTTFPIADPNLAAQVDDALKHQVGGEPLLYRGPYVTLNRPFEPGPPLATLIQELDLHPALQSAFPFEALHKHQEEALRAIIAGWHTILSTGTGSGKTEAFLLPVIDHCLRLRDSNTPIGVIAVLVYPMNALVNDQLERLRHTLAGTRITFGRYTGDTPERAGDDVLQLQEPRPYTEGEKQTHLDGEVLPHPWEECVDRRSIRERRPRILLTNYAQLEYLLLQHRDLDLFQGAPLRFLVFDEVHTYTGELGSEVACLIRRLREVAHKSPADVICVGTSATVTDDPEADSPIDGEAATRYFAHRLFGVPQEHITFITESYQSIEEAIGLYTPPPSADFHGLFLHILDVAADVHRRDEVGDISLELLNLAEELCGHVAPDGITTTERLCHLLAGNRVIRRLEMLLDRPKLLEDVLPALRQLEGRRDTQDDELIAEIMALLTLGAIAEKDGEPLLRPKLHYFIQGFQGLYISFEDDWLQLHFERGSGINEAGNLLFPLLLCRSCGQHYTQLLASAVDAIEVEGHRTGYRLTRIAEGFDEPNTSEELLTLTNSLHTQEDDEELPNVMYLCRVCGTLHPENEPFCMNPQCHTDTSLIQMLVWEKEPSRCPACGGMNRGTTRLITRTRSADVADVTILSQSMLAAMPEPSMRKLLIFADNRQDAAFQAGWMEERAKRFRMRHLLYRLLNNDPERIWGFDNLVERLLEEAEAEQIISGSSWDNEDGRIRVRWFLVEEFASPTQRRSSLEQLGLARVHYKDLAVDTDPDFFANWATVFGCIPERVMEVAWLLLDYYRSQGVLSEPLLARYWSPQDREVRHGLVATAEYYRPLALVREGGRYSNHTKGWLASNGRSAAQVLVKSVFPRGGESTDSFLTALWTWFISHDFFVETELIRRRYGRIEPIPISETTYQVNIDRMGISETSQRWLCDTCRRAFSQLTPNEMCPGYSCNGHLSLAHRDEEHYDVVQYTRLQFVPMRSYEHSAQVPKAKREYVEREFKKENGEYNTIVATPTLEMGVDIGKLEMVLMRNVPPNPANYAQRAGRAGRRHRIAVVFSYARGSQHDRYFFEDPPEMISGQIRVPAFSMRNEPLIRKQVHSATLTALRHLVSQEEQAVLDRAFPPYIWAYFGEWATMAGGKKRFRYLDMPPSFPDLAELLNSYHDRIVERLVRIFTNTWPEEEAIAVTRERLSEYLLGMSAQLESRAHLLFAEIQRYRDAIRSYTEMEQNGYSLNRDEGARKYRFEQALSSYRQEVLQNWSLGYLSTDGFLPGYALSRKSVLAQSLDPLLEISRPAAVALRELTPGNFIYADKRVFQIRTLNFYKLRAQDKEWSPDLLRQELVLDRTHNRVFDPELGSIEGGSNNITRFQSYHLTDVEMDQLQDIDDRREYRQQIAFDIYGMTMSYHHGGRAGRLGEREFRYLRQENIRLVNLGPTRPGPASPGIGFPICAHCGETRHARASEKEIQVFREAHQKRCQVPDILWTAIHVEMPSDVLMIGPYIKEAEAVNLFEGLRFGARMVLDMGESEVEGFPATDEYGQWWAVLYDPLPGGSGFLPEILNYWPPIVERAMDGLASCTCQDACYRCMKHFRNQQFHSLYNRFQAIDLLQTLRDGPFYDHEIPATAISHSDPQLEKVSESPAEEVFFRLLRDRSFPLPEAAQYRVDLGRREFTVADYAYPTSKVLIFIDGLSDKLHGDPARSQRDRLYRAKARMRGYQVVEIPAEALRDDVMISGLLQELALYLNAAD